MMILGYKDAESLTGVCRNQTCVSISIYKFR
jgi:hypothetical protein